MGLSCYGLSQQGLTGSGRSHQKGSLGKLGSDLGIFTRIVKEVHNLRQGLLGLILSGHILKGNACFLLHIHLGVALSYAHDASAAHPAHGEIHQEYQEQEGDGVV